MFFILRLHVSVVRMKTGVAALLVLSLALGRYRVQYTSRYPA